MDTAGRIVDAWHTSPFNTGEEGWEAHFKAPSHETRFVKIHGRFCKGPFRIGVNGEMRSFATDDGIFGE
ncbi:unnamed protein product [Dovyalis caffra]|uniref:Uncharacterized protein n=1 Tax=Dovyalis caffra TaxID=77055 RepID=A0AAV1SPD6_9ROSI|nr:unnamed protein product [Dovyalis caffra]